MRISTFFCLLSVPLFSLSGYQEQPKQILLKPPVEKPETYPAPDDNLEEDDEVADRANRYEYNLYDRQQDRIDKNNREERLRQQYYYQQSAGESDTGTQYNRTKRASSQFFNPIGDD